MIITGLTASSRRILCT